MEAAVEPVPVPAFVGRTACPSRKPGRRSISKCFSSSSMIGRPIREQKQRQGDGHSQRRQRYAVREIVEHGLSPAEVGAISRIRMTSTRPSLCRARAVSTSASLRRHRRLSLARESGSTADVLISSRWTLPRASQMPSKAPSQSRANLALWTARLGSAVVRMPQQPDALPQRPMIY